MGSSAPVIQNFATYDISKMCYDNFVVKHERDVFYMSQALEQALKSQDAAEVPVGCVIVRSDVIIAAEHNRVCERKSVVAHTELLAIENACRNLGQTILNECELYVTLEPCAMCAGAIMLARIKRVIFGARNLRLGAFGSVWNFAHEPVFGHHPLITGDVLADECAKLLTSSFAQFRIQQ